jgi:hypothetical protein
MAAVKAPLAGLVERGFGNRPSKQAQLVPSKLAHINLGPTARLCSIGHSNEAKLLVSCQPAGGSGSAGTSRAGSGRRRPGCSGGAWSGPVGSEGSRTRRRPDVRGGGGARKECSKALTVASSRSEVIPQIPNSLPMNLLSQIVSAAVV